MNQSVFTTMAAGWELYLALSESMFRLHHTSLEAQLRQAFMAGGLEALGIILTASSPEEFEAVVVQILAGFEEAANAQT